MPFFDANPSRPKDEILNDIRLAAQQSHMPGLPLVPFGALLAKVGGEASETIGDLKKHITRLNEENSKLQRWVLVLALAALISTVVQTAFAVLAYIYPPKNGHTPAAVSAPVSQVAANQIPSPKLAEKSLAANQMMAKASDLPANAVPAPSAQSSGSAK